MSRSDPAATPLEPTFYLIEADDPDPAGARAHGVGHDSPTLLGFWIYLMSDALIFATLFATYGVLATAYAGGPTGRDLFDLPLVALNTGLLLGSSITYGMGMLAMQDGRAGAVRLWLALTGVLGLAFVGVEIYEFAHLIAHGATPRTSAFLSAFFTLVGTHGLHVVFGVLWIGVMILQVGRHGLIAENRRRLMCLGMFWHLLDVVWIGVFTFVYLLGALQ